MADDPAAEDPAKKGERNRASRGTERLEGVRQRNLDWSRRQRAGGSKASSAWQRQSWTLPRAEARETAREYYRKFPRAAYATEVESWRVLPGDVIEFTMRRLPTAD